MPNFFLVGAPKAGTTSLYRYLDQHPDVYMSPVKEPCYFCEEIRLQQFSEWDDYLRLFEDVKGETAIGEGSVLYLWSKSAAHNIRLKVPDAKILMVLREPVGRAFSEYLHGITEGAVRGTFRKYIENSLSHGSDKASEVWPCLEFGLYSAGVKRYLDHFSRENVHIVLYEEFQEQQAKVMSRIFEFIGVDPTFLPDTSERYHVPHVPRSLRFGYFLKKHKVWQRAAGMKPSRFRSFVKKFVVRKSTPAVSPSDREFLLDYYRADMQKLATLLDRDLAAWLR
jgi:hypothetical protein